MLALEEAFISLCGISRAIIFVSIAKLSDRCFCYLTAAMFVSLRRTQTWRLHTQLYKFGWHSSANNSQMKNSRGLILGEVFYISIIYRIQDSWLYSLNGYNFSFDRMTGENRELNFSGSKKKLKVAFWLNNFACWELKSIKVNGGSGWGLQMSPVI